MSNKTTDQLLQSMMEDLADLDVAVGVAEADLETMRGNRARLAGAIEEVQTRLGVATEEEPYKSLSMFEAALACLERYGAMGTAQLRDAMLGGGFTTRSSKENFYQSLYSLLKERSERDDPKVQKVDKKWELT